MIRVQRSPEPTALTTARARRLAAAMQAYAGRSGPSPELSETLTGYDARSVKETLYADQHKKCAWCERRRDFSSSPIEHFRPKNGAWRHLPGESSQISREHYWWLTWTWENLLFACQRCNDQGHKANYFPLVAGTAELPAPRSPLPAVLPAAHFDLSAEKPRLLDPALDTFLDHVRWVPSNTHQARRLWTWSPRARTERGAATIKILKLEELADEIQQHLVDHVLQGVEDVEQHLRGRRTRQASERWDAVLRLLEPDRSFTSATWCALTRWVDDSAQLRAALAAAQLEAPPRPR